MNENDRIYLNSLMEDLTPSGSGDIEPAEMRILAIEFLLAGIISLLNKEGYPCDHLFRVHSLSLDDLLGTNWSYFDKVFDRVRFLATHLYGASLSEN